MWNVLFCFSSFCIDVFLSYLNNGNTRPNHNQFVIATQHNILNKCVRPTVFNIRGVLGQKIAQNIEYLMTISKFWF